MTDKTIDDLMPYFQEYEKNRGKAEGYYNRAKYCFKSFKEYISLSNIDYLKLTIKEAQEYQAYLSGLINEDGSARYATSSINGIVAVLKAFYNFLLKSDYIPTNPFKYITGIRKEKTIPKNLLREKEMSEYLEMLFEFEDEDHLANELYRYRTHVIAELLYSTGMRIGEAALLKESDIDLEKSMVKITDIKTKHERYGILNEYAKEVLKLYITEMKDLFLAHGSKHNEYLFKSSTQQLCHWFNTRIQKYSNDKSFKSHNFRHSVGYHLLRAGCRIRYIQAILGHAELRSTAIYTKIDKEDLKGILDEYHPRTFRDKDKGVKDEIEL